MIGWWRRRSQASRLEWYVRGSFYAQVATAPVAVGGLVQLGLHGAALFAVVAAAAVHTAVCLLLVRAGIGAYLGRRAQPRGLVAAGAALTAAGVVAAYAVWSRPAAGPVAGVLLMLAVTYVSALAAAVRPRVSAAVAAACCLAAVVVDPGGGSSIALALLLPGVVVAYRVSLWMLGVVHELDRSRHVQAALAVAEERLRFSRDLHDVLGRTLSVVALKSALAAKLAGRGSDEAVTEMLQVRRIAEDSLAELRAVVGGYRAADLGVELAGARSLLTSAGITCRVVGDATNLPPAVQGTLGWVIREGTTNLLRHSEARTCTVTLRTTPATATLTIEHDGVPPHDPEATRVRFGGGLLGLTERLAGLGGTVTAERRPPDRFVLDAAVPLVAPMVTA